MRLAIFCIALGLSGCGQNQTLPKPEAEMPARDWQYYVANPGQIEPMQKICREWAASNMPADAQPAVVTTNCRAVAFAKSQLQIGK